MRKRLRKFLENKGFIYGSYNTDDDSSDVYYKYVDGIPFIYRLVYPHEGTNYRIMFRANPTETFDRWSNADYQRFYKDEEDFMKNWNKYLIFDDDCN